MTQRTAVAIQTLGCKLNQAESEDLVRRLAMSGYHVVRAGSPFDIYILNGCTITGTSDRKCRNLLRRAQQTSPEALIVAAGCYSKRLPDDSNRTDAEFVSHHGDQASLVSMLLKLKPPLPSKAGDKLTGPALRRTRSFIKIQEGCDYHCTYCIVPEVRGPASSLEADSVLTQIKQRVAEGYREVVLTGTNVGSYANKGLRLSGLVRRILDLTGIARLRVSSLQPADIDRDLIAAFSDKRLCRHIHMPLQSGSATVLRRMGRRYSLAEYLRATSKLTEEIPDIALTTDVIVGFPGETEEEHNQSLFFCRKMGYAAIHVFPYSPRPGTPAAGFPSPLIISMKRRTDQFLDLAKETRGKFHSRFIGRRMEVEFEQKVRGKTDTWSGLTDNYIRVRARSKDRIANTILPVTIADDCGSWVSGSIDRHGC